MARILHFPMDRDIPNSSLIHMVSSALVRVVFVTTTLSILKEKHLKLIARSLTLAALLGITTTANAQVTFNFFIDDVADGILTPPNLGGGTLTFGTDPGNGTFNLAQVGSATFNISAGTETFTNADLDSDLNNALFIISNDPAGRRVQFSDNGTVGPIGSGSVEFFNGNALLAFEPSNFGAGLNLYFSLNSSVTLFGDYRLLVVAPTVPEPGSIALLVGMASVSGMFLKRRKK